MNFNISQSLTKDRAAYGLALSKKVCTFNIDPPWISAQVAFHLVFLEIAIHLVFLETDFHPVFKVIKFTAEE